ncbi:hypothetical protein BD413DRAFT_39871 [Trametes elegans]|nr:hypothetical protein BD413DRAFT_39871 [Trametes elegans]
MTPPRLPDELCELVIDHCSRGIDTPDLISDSHSVLRACCLTCRAWLPRSRLQLYSCIRFRRHDQVDAFLETITALPFLGNHAEQLSVSPDIATEAYIPFARTELVQRLRRVRTLVLFVSWDKYPPGYHALAAQYPITELHLLVSFRRESDLFRVLSAFRNVERLHASPWLSRADGRMTSSAFMRYRPRFASLKALEIRSDSFLLYDCPLNLAFGPTLTELSLRWNSDYMFPGISAGFLDYVSQLHALQTLIFTFTFKLRTHLDQKDAAFSDWTASIISRTRGHSSLRTISLRFWQPGADWQDEPLSRRDFLDNLLSRAVQRSLNSPQHLRKVVLEVSEGAGDPPDAGVWWSREIHKRLPRLNAQIRVVLRPRHCECALESLLAERRN